MGRIARVVVPNHVHLIAVPESENGLRQAIGEAHRRYSRRINFREHWRGHLWQGRFASFVMDEAYLLAAARYVELNPVRAKLLAEPGNYPWSSASAHLAGKDDMLVKVAPLLGLVRLAGFPCERHGRRRNKNSASPRADGSSPRQREFLVRRGKSRQPCASSPEAWTEGDEKLN